MGKMRMGHDPRSKTKLGQGLIEAVKEIAEPKPLTPEMELKVQEILETYKETFKKLAELEAKEKQAPLPTIIPECSCKRQKFRDTNARKHTVLLRQELEGSHIELDELLTLKFQSMDKKIQELDAVASKLDIRVDYLLEEKPQEKQVVKEVIVEKPVTDPKVWMAIGLAILLNIGFILLK